MKSNSVRNEYVLNDIARKLATKNVHIIHTTHNSALVAAVKWIVLRNKIFMSVKTFQSVR